MESQHACYGSRATHDTRTPNLKPLTPFSTPNVITNYDCCSYSFLASMLNAVDIQGDEIRPLKTVNRISC